MALTYLVRDSHPHSLAIHNYMNNLSNTIGITADYNVEPAEWASTLFTVPNNHSDAYNIYFFIIDHDPDDEIPINKAVEAKKQPSSLYKKVTMTLILKTDSAQHCNNLVSDIIESLDRDTPMKVHITDSTKEAFELFKTQG